MNKVSVNKVPMNKLSIAKQIITKGLKNFITKGFFFVALIAITFLIIFKDNNIGTIIKTLATVKIQFVLIGVALIFLFVCCEGINIRRTLKLFSYDIKFKKALKYAFIGFFFCSITPSSSGGQPMQLYYMKKDDIELSHASLAILLEVASYQLVTIVIAIISVFANYKFISTISSSLKGLIIIGIAANTLFLVCLLLAIFSKDIIYKIIDFIFVILEKLKIKRLDLLRVKVDNQITEYQEGAIFIRKNKKLIVKIVFTTLIQVCSTFSIPFLVYKSFGLSNFSFLTILSLQSILNIAASSIPLPGAVGVSESGFLILFSTLFPAKILSSAMLLSRGISFYLFVSISGLVVLATHYLASRKKPVRELSKSF